MAINLHTIGMVVTDLGKSLSFYRSLGLEIPEGQDNEFHVEFTDKKVYQLALFQNLPY